MSKSFFGVLKSAEVVSLDANGGIDWEVTLATIQAKVETEIAECAERDSTIQSVLNAIYDKLPEGGSLPRPLAVNLTVSAIVNDATNVVAMGEWTNHVNDYLDRTVAFTGKRGRNGGLFRA